MSETIAAHDEQPMRPLLRRAARGRKLPEDLRVPVRIDRRSIIGRDAAQFRTALNRHVGGSPSETQKALIEIAVQLRMRLTAMDIRFAEAGDQTAHDAKQYLAWANSLSRLVARLGLEAAPVPRQTLAEYMAERYGTQGSQPRQNAPQTRRKPRQAQ